MRKINPKSSDIDSLKYSILISLHYYDISFHPERISKLKPYDNFFDLYFLFNLCQCNLFYTTLSE